VAIDFVPKGVRCNAISPGSIGGERFRECVADKPELEQELISYNYPDRIGRPLGFAVPSSDGTNATAGISERAIIRSSSPRDDG
jgi:NAD(P)-dependent dehydrogenase (short-subunit alcohol dehydrogenase family)